MTEFLFFRQTVKSMPLNPAIKDIPTMMELRYNLYGDGSRGTENSGGF
jgi:hypothetical protein